MKCLFVKIFLETGHATKSHEFPERFQTAVDPHPPSLRMVPISGNHVHTIWSSYLLLVLFTDASSQIQNNGPLFRYGLGIFLGCQNPENRALAAPLTCNRFFSFSFLSACTQIFTAFSQHDGSRITCGLGGLQGHCKAGD